VLKSSFNDGQRHNAEIIRRNSGIVVEAKPGRVYRGLGQNDRRTVVPLGTVEAKISLYGPKSPN
jgi:hypothetical protein